MKASQKFFAGIVIVSLIIPNLYVIFKGRESFPFTQAPMFGHYIGPKTYFYDFKFIGDNGNGQKILYPSLTYSQTESPLYFRTQRLFFKIYGSAEKNSCFGYYQNDSRERFEQRMSRFFSAYFKFLNKDTSGIQTIRLEIDQYNRQYDLKDSHIVGEYNVISKNFISTWKANQ
ncbi:hypothetical protein [Agriterribacter sp.]|uniref:hypothetical protein n=1 Tax=Agriterribacter sp. TaxID=2821509 RepID=UPI002D1FAE28|nr:hypothetical protein [Agriterribacter sp.]